MISFTIARLPTVPVRIRIAAPIQIDLAETGVWIRMQVGTVS